MENCETVKDEIYRELFSSVVYITKSIKKGWLVRGYNKDKIITKFESTKKLLLLTLNLISKGYCYPTFYFNINLEFEKYIKNSSSEVELTELVLAKELIYYVYKLDVDAIYELICHVGTSIVRNELVPVATNWADLE